MRIPLLLLLPALSAVAGCAPPYFAGLDVAAPLARQMTRVGFVGPVSTNESDIAIGMRFLPTKPTAASIGGLSITSGFVIADTPTTEWLAFAYLDASGTAQVSSTEFQLSLPGADPNYPLNEYDVTNTISNAASVVVFTFQPTASTSSTVQQITAQLPSGPAALLGALTSPLTIFTGTTPIGGSNAPAPQGTQDTFAFLTFVSPTYGTGTAQLTGTVVLFPSGGAVGGLAAAITPPIPRSLYYVSPATGASFISYFSAGAWVCWTSFGALSNLMPGVTHRLDAVLTSGDLLSTEGGTLRLYDPHGAGGTGTQELAVPLNGIQFCYEAYVGTTPYVFFSLPMSMKHGWGFNVYAVPTSSMKSLH